MFAMLLKERRENTAGSYIRKISSSIRRLNTTDLQGNNQADWSAVQWQRGLDRFSRPLSNESADGPGSTITSGNAVAILRSAGAVPGANGDAVVAEQRLTGDGTDLTQKQQQQLMQHYRIHHRRGENEYTLPEVGYVIVELLGHPVHHPYIDDPRYSEQLSSSQSSPTRFGPRNSKDRRMHYEFYKKYWNNKLIGNSIICIKMY